MLVDSVPTYAKLAELPIAMLVDPAPRFFSASHPKVVLLDPAVEVIKVPASKPMKVLLKPVIEPSTVLPVMNVFCTGSAKSSVFPETVNLFISLSKIVEFWIEVPVVPSQQTIILSVDKPGPAAKSSRSGELCIKCLSAELTHRVCVLLGLAAAVSNVTELTFSRCTISADSYTMLAFDRVPACSIPDNNFPISRTT
jgi:hypothetical protein